MFPSAPPPRKKESDETAKDGHHSAHPVPPESPKHLESETRELGSCHPQYRLKERKEGTEILDKDNETVISTIPSGPEGALGSSEQEVALSLSLSLFVFAFVTFCLLYKRGTKIPQCVQKSWGSVLSLHPMGPPG